MKSLLQKIDGYDFEYLIADLWTEQGWKTRVLPASNDRGIDVEARRSEPFEQKYLIQAKRYSASNKVGSEMIQQYASLQYQEENVDAVLIITTSSFTKPAKEIAADLNIKLIDGDDLTKIITKRDARDIVNNYTSFKGNSQKSNRNTTNNFLQTLSYPKATDEYVSKLVDNAVGETVTKESLAKTSGSFWWEQSLKPQFYYIYFEMNNRISFSNVEKSAFRARNFSIPRMVPVLWRLTIKYLLLLETIHTTWDSKYPIETS